MVLFKRDIEMDSDLLILGRRASMELLLLAFGDTHDVITMQSSVAYCGRSRISVLKRMRDSMFGHCVVVADGTSSTMKLGNDETWDTRCTAGMTSICIDKMTRDSWMQHNIMSTHYIVNAIRG
jgi:hypothetical protein